MFGIMDKYNVFTVVTRCFGGGGKSSSSSSGGGSKKSPRTNYGTSSHSYQKTMRSVGHHNTQDYVSQTD